MHRRVSRCVLLALLAAFFAVPATAGTIVGEFYFERDVFACGGDPACQPFEYFNLTNTVDPDGPLAGLTFSALIQINGINYDYQFIDSTPIAIYGFAITNGLVPGPLAAGGRASLVFNGGNVADYLGALSLSNDHGNVLYDDGTFAPPFSAQVVFTPNAVPEAPSWLVVVIALGALAVGRHVLA